MTAAICSCCRPWRACRGPTAWRCSWESHDSHGAYGRELLALIRRAGLGERVRFAGDVDDLPAALSLADVVVLPATRPDPSGCWRPRRRPWASR